MEFLERTADIYESMTPDAGNRGNQCRLASYQITGSVLFGTVVGYTTKEPTLPYPSALRARLGLHRSAVST